MDLQIPAPELVPATVLFGSLSSSIQALQDCGAQTEF